MTFPTAPPSPRSAPPEPPRRSDRFYGWVAGLGIARSDGWVGGVAAGIASRLRIDPLIVRGVLVVAALCGLPMILLYALAWALLPDPEGRIHLRDLFHGRFQPAQLGILAGVVVGLFTLTPSAGLFLLGRMLNPYAFQGYDYGVSGFGVFLFIVGLAVVTVLLVLIVRAARRTPGGVSSDPRMASAAPTAPRPSAPVGYSGATVDAEIREEDAGIEGTSPASSLLPEPSAEPSPEPSADADADALKTWRAQHAAWQEQDQTWRQQQQDAEKAARDRARVERQAVAAAFAAEAAERRRIRRDSNPRASVAYVATVIGVALVAATTVWLWSQNPDAATAGMALFTAALVLAFGMIVTGVARRRSGLLAFLTAAALVAGLLTGGAASLGNVRLGDASLANAGANAREIRQPFGNTGVILMSLPDPAPHPVVLHKGSGYTEIFVNDGVELQLTATVGDVSVEWSQTDYTPGKDIATTSGTFVGTPRPDGTTVYRETITSPPNPDDQAALPNITIAPVTIDQQSGRIVVVYSFRSEKEAAK